MEEINIEFGDDVKKALFQVVEDILQTDTFKVRIEPGSRKGILSFKLWNFFKNFFDDFKPKSP